MSLASRKDNFEQQLVDDIAEFYDDPVGYVLYAFNWSTGILKDSDGPDVWQRELLNDLGQAFKDDPFTTIRSAIASGHGIGKSAITSWLILWAMSTRPHLAGWVTANTKAQLISKTWRELALWHKRAINAHWFEWTATRFYHVEHKATWGMDAIPWSEANSEAFAGLHADHVLMIMDEASGIADIIWEVAEGAMTTPRAMWFAFGNPTRNTGRFRECFGKNAHRWRGRQIDSRTVKMTNKAQLGEWIEDYGEDSDFARVRIKGQFPSASSMQFIPDSIVDEAMGAELPVEVWHTMPVVIGVDVARFGDDESVITIRQGRKLHQQKCFRGVDTQTLASLTAVEIQRWMPQAVFIDDGGIGAGVVDRLVALGHRVIPVGFGRRALDEKSYFNLRAEIWGRMRDWLASGAEIPEDNELKRQLTGLEYGFTTKEQIQLERKKDAKKRGLESPDKADSLAVTFAEMVFINEQSSFEPDDF